MHNRQHTEPPSRLVSSPKRPSSHYLLHLDARPLRADLPEQRGLALLVRVVALLLALALVQRSPGHLALGRLSLAAARLDARVLERRAAQGHVVAAAQHQLQHLRVVEALDRLAVYVGYQVARSQAGLERRARLVDCLRIRCRFDGEMVTVVVMGLGVGQAGWYNLRLRCVLTGIFFFFF